VRPETAISPRSVPFLDLSCQHELIKDELLADIAELIDANAFINGPQVAEFELAFGRYCGSRCCVGVASGLDALRLALLAAGLEPGDEVVVPANTFVATLEAVIQAGGKPVPVDVTERDYNIDVQAAEAAIGSRTRFIVPVHLYGQLADMVSLDQLGQRYGVGLLEDAAQAHGAEREGRRAGTASLAGAFSFYPGKNLGAMGDAGALVTDDEDLAVAVRSLREHGQTRKYVHELVGYTSRLDTLQAIVLSRKLAFLDRWNDERRELANRYLDLLADVGDLRVPPVAPGSAPVWHLFVVRSADRQGLEEFLAERGIATGRHYPEAVHLSAAYADLGYGRGSFPVAESLADELLSLPLFPGMTDVQLEAVVDAIRDFYDRG
jgi:dTDP-4-amino-4,6-dideoxygalactose transaminase